MFKWFFIFILVLVLILIVFYNVLVWTEEKVLYYPSKKCVWRPRIKYRQVYINVEDCDDICYRQKHKKSKCEYISGWHFDNFPGAKTILFCHGNTGNITHRKYIIDMCDRLKINLFVFDYRGFGKSDSFPYKMFLKEDGEAAYHYLRSECNIPWRDITIWGESIGGVSASWIASQFKCCSLILMCTFSSLDDIVSYKFEGGGQKAIKMLTGLVSYNTDMLNIKQYLKKVECPVVLIHSDEDEMITYQCGWCNYDNILHEDKIHIKIKGKHASPKIRVSQFKRIFEYCDIPVKCSSRTIKTMLNNLETFAEENNNFMESY